MTGSIVIEEATESSDAITTNFNLAFEAVDEHRLRFRADTDALSAANGTNYLSMTYHSPVDEEIYGMGLQYSQWDFKGTQVPLITEEAGVGRGLEPISTFLNEFGGGSGGHATTSYAPAAQYITNKQRGFIFDPKSIGNAYFDGQFTTEMLYWHQD